MKDCIHVETFGIDGARGRFGFTAMPEQEVLTKDGWKMVKDLTDQDFLLTKYRSIINSSLHDFLWGALIGDSCIRINKTSTAYFSFQDSIDTKYMEWKVEKLNNAFQFKKNGDNRYDSALSTELRLLKDEVGERDPRVMLRNHYSDLGLAIWYMDDGHLDVHNRKRVTLSVKRLKGNQQALDEIADLLALRGVPCSSVLYNSGSIIYTRDRLNNLFDKIHKFIPSCMQHKLTNEYKEKYEDFELEYNVVMNQYYVPIVLIRPISDRQIKHKFIYSIKVGKSDNFMIGGVSNGIVVKSYCDQKQ
jgi:hypothetical protein